MTSSLPPALVKAVNGDYQLHIGAILFETWRRVTTLKKTAWGRLGLFLFIILALGMLISSGLNGILSLSGKSSLLANNFYLLLRLAHDVLLWLLGIFLIVFALKHIRSAAINMQLILDTFREWWRSLIFVGLVYCLFNWGLSYINDFFLRKLVQALDLQISIAQPWSLHSILSGLSLLSINFTLSILPYIYVTMVLAMAMVLILDKKLAINKSLRLAFRAINQRFSKNISLGFVVALLLFIDSVMLEMIVMVLRGMSFFNFAVVKLGINLIILPIIALITAMQYRQIFCEGEPVLEI